MQKKLSAEMRTALIEIFRGESRAISARTLKALISMGLLGGDFELTLQGWKQSIVLLPLQEQCRALEIGYEEIPNVKGVGRPEIAALKYFESRGFIGSHCEGGAILLLIRSAALDILTRLNTFHSRKDACTRFTEAQLLIHKSSADEILSAIRSASLERTIENFSEIYKALSVQDYYPGLSANIMGALFSAIGAEAIANVASAMIDGDSYGYRAGWPDLTLTNGNEMIWAEIKTSDRLHMSQISTISKMKPLLPGKICVIRLA